MRRFWLFLSFVLLAAGCPSDDTDVNEDDGSDTTDGGDDDDDDDDDSGSSGSPTTDPDSSSDGGSSSSASTDPDSSSTTVAGPVCGDGVMDEGEECDDENMDNGDACSAECTIPFEILWTATHNGSASNQDDANEVVVGDDGNIYVAGSERNTGTGSDVWVQQYMADGTEGWTFTWNGADELDDGASSIAFDADGNLLVGGSTESAATGDDILVLQIDIATQELIGEPMIVDGPGSGLGETDDEDFGNDVAISAAGTIIATGAVRVDAESWNIWVGELDPAMQPTPVVWEQIYNGPDSGPDIAQQVYGAPDGTVYVLANQQLEDNSTVGLVLAYADDGTPQDAATVDLDYVVNDFAIDGDGNIAIVGSAEPGNSGFDIVTNFYDAAFALQWTAVHDGPYSTDDAGRAVAFDAAGHLATVGRHAVMGQSNDGWIGTYQAADGAPWWGDSHQSKSELDDSFADVAVTPDGDFVVVGSESVIGQQRNAFVRVYHPL